MCLNVGSHLVLEIILYIYACEKLGIMGSSLFYLYTLRFFHGFVPTRTSSNCKCRPLRISLKDGLAAWMGKTITMHGLRMDLLCDSYEKLNSSAPAVWRWASLDKSDVWLPKQKPPFEIYSVFDKEMCSARVSVRSIKDMCRFRCWLLWGEIMCFRRLKYEMCVQSTKPFRLLSTFIRWN